jgi:PAS domain S-box-containing protein
VPIPDFAFLAENATDFIGICDLELRPLFVNREGRRLVGLPEAGGLDTIGVLDWFFPEDRDLLSGPFLDQVRREGRASIEVRFRHFLTGEPIWMAYHVIRMEDAAGQHTGYATISTDLTQHRRAEQALRDLADSMPQIVWSSDASGVTDYYNRRWHELTGGGADTKESARAIIHEDDRESTRRAWEAAFAAGALFEHEYRLRFPASTEDRWYLGRSVPVKDAGGKVVRWYGTSTDIHELKMAEAELAESRERLRAALDASSTGTSRWDIDAGDVEWDDNLYRLFGLLPGPGSRPLDYFMALVHEDDRQRVIDGCRRCAEEGADFEAEFRVVWPDGAVHWLYEKGRVYTAANGRRYMIAACVDITERRNKEDALRAADRQKDEFLGMLSHEIRNPLAPMMYSVNLLERQITDPALRRPLDVIGRQLRRMVHIVDDLLDASRVTHGKISLKRASVSLTEIVSQAVEASRSRMEAHGHALIHEAAQEPLLMSGDAARLGQVLENLLANAAKYTPNGGTVTVRVEREGGEAVITVADTGVGIDAAMLPRVFDLFAQADTSLDRSEGGLGIGLTLADRLTRLHGGRLSAHSDGLGAGSTFIVRLPLLGDRSRASADEPVPDRANVARRVLIVDGNVDAAVALGLLLEMNGHAVRRVHHGPAAVDAAREFRPDAVLLDISLPGMNGFEVLKRLRELADGRPLAIIATTGYGRDEDRRRCLAAGFDEHLTKPIAIGDVERLLSALAVKAAG